MHQQISNVFEGRNKWEFKQIHIYEQKQETI